MSTRRPTPDTAARPHAAEEVLRRLEWTVLRRLDGLLQGDYRTLFRGSGLDFADLREYQHHDDVRYIDWNVTARLQTPYVREYTESREMAAWMLLDLSGSVDFGSQYVTKQSVSRDFVAILARLLTRHGNRIGAIFHRDGVESVLPARGGRQQVLQLLHTIARTPERMSGRTRGQRTDLRQPLRTALKMISKRSTVFIVSDFLSVPGWAAPLAQLVQRHEVIAVRLLDPLEQRLPDLGLITMQDAETGEQLFVDTHDAVFRRRFAAAAQRHENELRAAFSAAGVDVLELSTDGDLVDAVLRFADLRRRRSRFAAGGVLAANRATAMGGTR